MRRKRSRKKGCLTEEERRLIAGFFAKVFQRMLEHMENSGHPRWGFFARRNGELNTVKISLFIERDPELYGEYLRICRDTRMRDGIDCASKIRWVIRSWLLGLYRSNIEPVSSFVKICLLKGYVSIDDLREVLQKCSVDT